jgi:ABC-type sugar transport system substrate-binding protein
MAGKNWYSKKHEWRDVVKPRTKAMAALAAKLRESGVPVVTIATMFDLSQGRIYELLRT